MRILLLGLLLSSLSEASIPPQWEEFKAPGVEKMWKSSAVKEAYVSLMLDSSNFIMSDFDPKIYVQALPDVRSTIHNIIGISHFKIEKSQSERTADSWIVKIEGTYLRKNNLKHSFCELHTYTANSFVQKQLFFPTPESQKVLQTQNCFETLSAVTK